MNEANEQRNKILSQLRDELQRVADAYGIRINALRVEWIDTSTVDDSNSGRIGAIHIDATA